MQRWTARYRQRSALLWATICCGSSQPPFGEKPGAAHAYPPDHDFGSVRHRARHSAALDRRRPIQSSTIKSSTILSALLAVSIGLAVLRGGRRARCRRHKSSPRRSGCSRGAPPPFGHACRDRTRQVPCASRRRSRLCARRDLMPLPCTEIAHDLVGEAEPRGPRSLRVSRSRTSRSLTHAAPARSTGWRAWRRALGERVPPAGALGYASNLAAPLFALFGNLRDLSEDRIGRPKWRTRADSLMRAAISLIADLNTLARPQKIPCSDA
jgi:hypothetical protein